MRRRHAPIALLGAGIMICSASLAFAGATPAPAPEIVKTSTLPTIGLADFQEELFPGTEYEANPMPPNGAEPDRRVDLGGVGSDLFRAPGTSTNEFWMITDRGPNGESASGRRSFPTPWFTPTILHVRANGGAMEILDALPIVGGSECDAAVGGLPNLGVNSYDDPPYAYDFRDPAFDYSPSGLDTEGLVRTANGEFWFAEEYSPSIGRLDANGCVVTRYVPEGLPLAGTGYEVDKSADSIPAIYQLRKKNRGFEALGLSPSGSYLFVGLQSPLLNPTTSAGNLSLNTRILRYDLAEGTFDAEYVYRFQPETEYEQGGTTPNARPRDLKLSAIVALDDDTLLVLERTDVVAKIYLAELGEATNILGDWDCVGGSATLTFLGSVAVPKCSSTNPPTGTKSIEQMSDSDLTLNSITKIHKSRLVAEIDARSGLPEKIEGIAVLNKVQIAVANDNDFNIMGGGLGEAFDADGNMILRTAPGTTLPVPSQILRIKLAEPLPIGG